jgi:small subunit ribosomal protein S15
MQLENELLKKYRHHEKDTGSTECQVILLQEKITREKVHLVNNKKDIPTKRALLKKIAQQKIFLKYLQKNNPEVYEELKKLK